MRDDIVIRKVLMDCPACRHRHFVEERDREVCWSIEKQHILSHERYYHCPFADEEYNEWQTYEMEEESSQNGHDIYRKNNGLLTSIDIFNIRVQYRLSCEELEILLGLKPDSIARYERDIVQSKKEDERLRLVKDDPLKLVVMVSLRRDKFSAQRRREILDRISEVYYEYEAKKILQYTNDHTRERNFNPHTKYVNIHEIWNQ